MTWSWTKAETLLRSKLNSRIMDCPNDTRHGRIDKFHFVYTNNWRCSDTIFASAFSKRSKLFRFLTIYLLTRLAHMCCSHSYTRKIIIYGFPPTLQSVRNICLGVCSRAERIHKLFIKNNRDTAARAFVHLNVVKLQRFTLRKRYGKNGMCVSSWCPNRWYWAKCRNYVLVRLTRYELEIIRILLLVVYAT